MKEKTVQTNDEMNNDLIKEEYAPAEFLILIDDLKKFSKI